MKNDEIVSRNIAEHLEIIEQVSGALSEQIGVVGSLISTSLREEGTVFWCGNGGSASDSQHLAAELIGRFKKNRRPLRSVALNADTSVLTCIGNDFGFDDIFSRQIEGLARPGDVLVGVSTSGQSENVLRALKTAKDMGVVTVALLGKGGGPAKDIVDHALVVPSDVTARIQEAHILIGHILCEIIEKELGLS